MSTVWMEKISLFFILQYLIALIPFLVLRAASEDAYSTLTIDNVVLNTYQRARGKRGELLMRSYFGPQARLQACSLASEQQLMY